MLKKSHVIKCISNKILLALQPFLFAHQNQWKVQQRSKPIGQLLMGQKQTPQHNKGSQKNKTKINGSNTVLCYQQVLQCMEGCRMPLWKCGSVSAEKNSATLTMNHVGPSPTRTLRNFTNVRMYQILSPLSNS